MDPIQKHADASKVYLFDFTAELATGDTLVVDAINENPSVDSETAGLTIGDPVINNAEVTQDGKTVAANKGVQCRISGGTADTSYLLKAIAKTNDGDTLVVEQLLEVI